MARRTGRRNESVPREPDVRKQEADCRVPLLLAQLDGLREKTQGLVEIDAKHRLLVKHPSRILWPRLRLTTVDLMSFYVRIAGVLLPHVRDRPLAFRRFPKGTEGPSRSISASNGLRLPA